MSQPQSGTAMSNAAIFKRSLQATGGADSIRQGGSVNHQLISKVH